MSEFWNFNCQIISLATVTEPVFFYEGLGHLDVQALYSLLTQNSYLYYFYPFYENEKMRVKLFYRKLRREYDPFQKRVGGQHTGLRKIFFIIPLTQELEIVSHRTM